MSKFAKFMKQNKKEKKNIFLPVTELITDENGDPALWEIRPLKSDEDSTIREACYKRIPVPGKKNQFTRELNTEEYLTQMIVHSIVEPDLWDAELQNSYGVTNESDLLGEMLLGGEKMALATAIQQFNGFDVTLEEKVDEAKN